MSKKLLFLALTMLHGVAYAAGNPNCCLPTF
jgi:hypothetical protein